MPQIFQVLRCFKCLVFQVHQTKKSNKFVCKMCGEKQSIKRHYGLGNGQECRKHVQKLNEVRGEMDESKSFSISTDDEDENISNIEPIEQTHQNKPSKWLEYVSKDIEKKELPDDNEDDTMYLDNTEVVLELPKKRRKIFVKKISVDSIQSSNENIASAPQPIQTFTSSNSNIQVSAVKNNTFTPPIKKDTSLAHDFQDFKTSSGSKWERHDDAIFNPVHAEVSTPINRLKFVPPAIDKNSKWAKFAEDCDDNEENEIEEFEATSSIRLRHDSQTEARGLFSLCDDNDLDDFLAI